mmetsp:Transcript_3203/g.7302  ORF Transcript_3203/g.7302 Transcript_3203/m.7302 type:complete len:307 (+) Transcript_3203:1105-2025(+)
MRRRPGRFFLAHSSAVLQALLLVEPDDFFRIVQEAVRCRAPQQRRSASSFVLVRREASGVVLAETASGRVVLLLLLLLLQELLLLVSMIRERGWHGLQYAVNELLRFVLPHQHPNGFRACSLVVRHVRQLYLATQARVVVVVIVPHRIDQKPPSGNAFLAECLQDVRYDGIATNRVVLSASPVVFLLVQSEKHLQPIVSNILLVVIELVLPDNPFNRRVCQNIVARDVGDAVSRSIGAHGRRRIIYRLHVFVPPVLIVMIPVLWSCRRTTMVIATLRVAASNFYTRILIQLECKFVKVDGELFRFG